MTSTPNSPNTNAGMGAAASGVGPANAASKGRLEGSGMFRASLPPDVAVESLWTHVSEGVGGAEGTELRARLGLPADADERSVLRKLLRALSVSSLVQVTAKRRALDDPRPSVLPTRVQSADSSFLGTLGTAGTGGHEMDDVTDVRTVLAVVRAGTLRQRRSALQRLRDMIKAKRSLGAEELRNATEALAGLRDPELTYDLMLTREVLPGGDARRVKSERESVRRVVDDLLAALPPYWDGQVQQEPVTSLPGDQRAGLLALLRELPDVLVGHIAAVIEGSGAVRDPAMRLALLSSVRYAADPRIVPSLRAVLESSEPEFVEEAARALARIDDPRVHPALVGVYERTHRDETRLVLAASLGLVGDARGLEYAQKSLAHRDATVALAGLEALSTLGTAEDSELIIGFLDHPDALVPAQAVRTLGRIGDARAVTALVDLAAKNRGSALRVEVEDALLSIRARMELRGEDAQATAVGLDAPRLSMVPGAPLARPHTSAWARFRAMRHFLVGRLWLIFGALERASRRFEAAAAASPEWSAPHIAVAMALEHRQQYARALVSFRRALEVDRSSVERNPLVVWSLARCFLRRAEQLREDGRIPIARGLLDEVLALDLRWAPSGLRFELGRLQRNLGREG